MDKKLSIYNKVILFCSNCIFFAEQEDVKLYESRYIKYEDIKEKSVYYLAFNFINEFIQK